MITRAHTFIGAMTALTVVMVVVPLAQADGCRTYTVSATAQAEALRVQSVQRAQAQLGYHQLYTDTNQSYIVATVVTAQRYATIDDQIAQLGAMIAASNTKSPPGEILLDP